MTEAIKISDTNCQHATLESLFQAYFDCRRNKRYTLNALAFETDYENNLVALCDELNRGDYSPGRSIAFVITKPVKREIFAADFRDRVVHHWLINQLNPLFERAFIYDSYASRKERGAHLGIQRADRFIRQCSHHYSRDCYVLKLDIQSFFIRINKRILLESLHTFIERRYQCANQNTVLELIDKVILNDPTTNCFIKSNKRCWHDFPPDKSLFHARTDCGLPIGNLTSQVFANFYLNSFDHFVKHDLGVRFYGRYVDDFILVHEDKAYLKSLIPTLAQFLHEELQLDLHPRKIHLQHYAKGVNFLGVTIKSNRIYIGKRTKGNFYDAITQHNNKTREKKPRKEEQAAFLCSMNSFLGIMKHYNTYRLRRRMLRKHLSIWWWNLMYLSGSASKLVPRQKTIR
jgi:RNA-directed DNA polymerase